MRRDKRLKPTHCPYSRLRQTVIPLLSGLRSWGPTSRAANRQATDNMETGQLHYELIRALLDTCLLPDNAVLANRLHCSARDLQGCFDELAGQHGVVLHPNSHCVWVIHPFSLAPTPFLVRAGERRWWGNCAWCSLGIASLLDEPCTITSSLGAEEEQVVMSVENGRVTPDDLLVHFPIPMARAWDNVIYTCSTMLLFRNADDVRGWSQRHGLPVGDLQPVTKVMELAKRWYGNYLRPDWRKRTTEEARVIFTDLGFSHPVWDVDAISGRF